MKSDQRTRALGFPLFIPEPLPPGIITFVHVDGVTWQRVRIADGSLGWAGSCTCGKPLHSSCGPIKPIALYCIRCKAWRRLP